ncbi:MAG: molybdenum cofactor biosynthesis protein MoaE, partial [Planctomycetota bacterium]|nr:molybdenum cofactor biosynthesis protein MoaE [Planctomycetota bacterium]
MGERFAITEGAIDADAVRAAVTGPESGAVIVFHGTVRDRTEDRRVTYLEYEAYEPMALAEMQRIADELVAEYGVAAIACTHRIGRLDIGDDAMVV